MTPPRRNVSTAWARRSGLSIPGGAIWRPEGMMGKSQLFEARSQMPVDAEAVFAWHAREGAFERLQPPWESVEVVERQGEGVREGVRVVVRVKVGPVPM